MSSNLIQLRLPKRSKDAQEALLIWRAMEEDGTAQTWLIQKLLEAGGITPASKAHLDLTRLSVTVEELKDVLKDLKRSGVAYQPRQEEVVNNDISVEDPLIAGVLARIKGSK
jgi:hypothetical protein